jgi:hypothetical protein
MDGLAGFTEIDTSETAGGGAGFVGVLLLLAPPEQPIAPTTTAKETTTIKVRIQTDNEIDRGMISCNQ